jgi:hypothetical protein
MNNAYHKQVNQNELQAQMFIRNVQEKQKKLKKQKVAGTATGMAQFRKQ